jgi:hypothetical protein
MIVKQCWFYALPDPDDDQLSAGGERKLDGLNRPVPNDINGGADVWSKHPIAYEQLFQKTLRPPRYLQFAQ